MKRLVTAVVMASMLAVGTPALGAEDMYSGSSDTDQYEDAFSNPLRLAYYVIHPIGFTVEWLIMRPFHYLISRPYLDNVFGYEPLGDEGMYSRMGDKM
jgi:hypothetical protein